MMKSLLLILVMLIISMNIFAEEGTDKNKDQYFWVEGCLGADINNENGAAIELSLNVIKGKNVYAVQYLSCSVPLNIAINDSGIKPEDFKYSAGEIGILYGKIFKAKSGYVALLGGLSYTGVKTEYKGEVRNTIGIPLKAQVGWTPTKVLGLTASVFANVNAYRCYAGFLAGLQIGVLR